MLYYLFYFHPVTLLFALKLIIKKNFDVKLKRKKNSENCEPPVIAAYRLDSR